MRLLTLPFADAPGRIRSFRAAASPEIHREAAKLMAAFVVFASDRFLPGLAMGLGGGTQRARFARIGRR